MATKITKITKGTEVWMFGDWNHGATVYVRRLTITSFGKKQGTAVSVEDGKNVEHRLYTNETHLGMPRFIAVADMADPTEEALRRAAIQKAHHIECNVNTVHHYALQPDNWSSEAFYRSMKQGCEKLIAQEPAVHFWTK